jgi:hypothetical protein
MRKTSQWEGVLFSLSWPPTLAADVSLARIGGMRHTPSSATITAAKAIFTSTETKESTKLKATRDRVFHLLQLAEIAQVEAVQAGSDPY